MIPYLKKPYMYIGHNINKQRLTGGALTRIRTCMLSLFHERCQVNMWESHPHTISVIGQKDPLFFLTHLTKKDLRPNGSTVLS